MSKRAWMDETWNPTTGCTKVSPGCKHCYAELMSERLHAMGQKKYLKVFEPVFHKDTLEKPYRWAKPREVFVSSMSDLFHEDFSLDDVIKPVFEVMNDLPRHRFQVLTKRAERLAALSNHLKWTPNIWVGVSVESEKYVGRIDELRKVPATVRFLSLEPLLGALSPLDLSGIHWVLVGGESGSGARPMEKAWVRDIRDQCVREKVPFVFHQWGGDQRSSTGHLLDGRAWDEHP
jgi:protein gp37